MILRNGESVVATTVLPHSGVMGQVHTFAMRGHVYRSGDVHGPTRVPALVARQETARGTLYSFILPGDDNPGLAEWLASG